VCLACSRERNYRSPTLIEVRRVEIDDLPERPPVRVTEIRENEILLSCLWRRRIDDVIEVRTFTLPKADLPRGIDKASVLLPKDDGKYALSKKSMLEFRNEFVCERLAERRLRRQEGV